MIADTELQSERGTDRIQLRSIYTSDLTSIKDKWSVIDLMKLASDVLEQSVTPSLIQSAFLYTRIELFNAEEIITKMFD